MICFFQNELVFKLVRPQPLVNTDIKVRSTFKKILGVFKYMKIEIIPREVIMF